VVHRLAAVTGELRSTELIYRWDPERPAWGSPAQTIATTCTSLGRMTARDGARVTGAAERTATSPGIG